MSIWVKTEAYRKISDVRRIDVPNIDYREVKNKST